MGFGRPRLQVSRQALLGAGVVQIVEVAHSRHHSLTGLRTPKSSSLYYPARGAVGVGGRGADRMQARERERERERKKDRERKKNREIERETERERERQTGDKLGIGQRLVFELGGVSLYTFIQEGGPIASSRARKLMKQLADGCQWISFGHLAA